jgi:hypothetical protein
MNRRTLIRFAVLALVARGARAQNALQIITLRHRTADQVLPSLRPLLEPGATISGQGSQLFVRTSAANLDDLRLALEVLDTPQRRLLMSVRFDDERDAASRSLGASGRFGNRDSQVAIRGGDSQSSVTERVDQRIQATDGMRALIYTGQSRPLRQRQFIQTPAGVVSQEVTVVQELTSGFEVIPRLLGDTVQIELVQQRQGSADYQRAATTASGRLGEWFSLGAVASTAAGDAETRRVWIRVDELP